MQIKEHVNIFSYKVKTTPLQVLEKVSSVPYGTKACLITVSPRLCFRQILLIVGKRDPNYR